MFLKYRFAYTNRLWLMYVTNWRQFTKLCSICVVFLNIWCDSRIICDRVLIFKFRKRNRIYAFSILFYAWGIFFSDICFETDDSYQEKSRLSRILASNIWLLTVHCKLTFIRGHFISRFSFVKLVCDDNCSRQSLVQTRVAKTNIRQGLIRPE